MRGMRRSLALIAILLAGCSGSAPTCQQVADRMLALAADQAIARGRPVVGTSSYTIVAERCTQDGWSAEARSCLVGVTSLAELGRCRDDLGDAAAALTARFLAESDKLDELERAKTSGLVVELPKAASGEIDPALASVVIDITADGTFVQGKAVPDAELDNVFRAAFARDKRTQVILRATEGTPHGRVVGVMDRAKASGLTRLAIATSPAP